MSVVTRVARRVLFVTLGIRLVASARLGLRREQQGSQPPCKKVFVVGCPRSGKTEVHGALCSHPAAVGVEETAAIRRVENAVRRGRHSVAGWSRLLYGVDRGVQLGQRIGLHNLVDTRELRRLATDAIQTGMTTDEVMWKLIDSLYDGFFYAHGSNVGEVLAEKTSASPGDVELLLRRYSDAKVIVVVRDGRDVCASMQEFSIHPDRQHASREDQITLWVDYTKQSLLLIETPVLAPRLMLLRYEDLLRDPELAIHRVFDFVGLDTDETLVRSIAAETSPDHHDATRDRYRSRIGGVGHYVNFFTAADEHLFRELAGPTFLRAGYRL